MKAKTKIRNGVYVFFAYEDWDMLDMSGNYGENDCKLLCGYLVNEYHNCCEKIDEYDPKGNKPKPTIAQVKEFMQHCFDCLRN
jgi:hypothetical protein